MCFCERRPHPLRKGSAAPSAGASVCSLGLWTSGPVIRRKTVHCLSRTDTDRFTRVTEAELCWPVSPGRALDLQPRALTSSLRSRPRLCLHRSAPGQHAAGAQRLCEGSGRRRQKCEVTGEVLWTAPACGVSVTVFFQSQPRPCLLFIRRARSWRREPPRSSESVGG